MAELLHAVEGATSFEPGDLEVIEGVVEADLLTAAISVLDATL